MKSCRFLYLLCMNDIQVGVRISESDFRCNKEEIFKIIFEFYIWNCLRNLIKLILKKGLNTLGLVLKNQILLHLTSLIH